MRVNRWWPDRSCVVDVAEFGGELSTRRRRYEFRSPFGGVPRALRGWTRRESTARSSAIPGPARRSSGWEVRAHDDLLYFLHSGQPRFVMSQAMAQSAYGAIMARLSGEPEPVHAAPVSAPTAPAPDVTKAAVLGPSVLSDLQVRRDVRSRAPVITGRQFLGLPAVLAASLVVLAVGLTAAIVSTPWLIGRVVPGARPQAEPAVSLKSPANVPAAIRARVQPAVPAPHPSREAARVSAPARVPYAVALSRVIPVGPSPRFVVVSGSLPRAVAVRRASALVASGLTETPRVMPLSATRAAVYYGGFSSNAEAQALATRVRTLGYTAAVVTE